MNDKFLNLYLAEDDLDDSLFFEEILNEQQTPIQLTIAQNGEELMQLLGKAHTLPDIVFLDLNMPLKNGFECVNEIRANEKLKDIKVIVFSTFFSPAVLDNLYDSGADYCIQKPSSFSEFSRIISYAIQLARTSETQPGRDKFVLDRYAV